MVGGVEIGSWVERTQGKAVAGGPGGQESSWWTTWQSHIHMQTSTREQQGSETDHETQGFSTGTKD